jgi:hypothetical protein
MAPDYHFAAWYRTILPQLLVPFCRTVCAAGPERAPGTERPSSDIDLLVMVRFANTGR